MVARLRSEDDLDVRMRKTICGVAGILVLTGLGLILSGIFFYVGMVLGGLAVVIFLIGCAASWVFPKAVLLWDVVRPSGRRATQP